MNPLDDQDMADMDNVVEIGDLRLARLVDSYARRREGCQHHSLLMDPVGEIVTCRDCKQQVSPYWALSKIVKYWDEHARKVERELTLAKEQQGAVLHLTAAKKIEAAWRKRDTLPSCPHCARGILPDDGMGESTVGKAFELGLRVRERAERAELGLPAARKLAPGKPKAPAKKATGPRPSGKPLPKWKDAPAWAQWLTHSPAGPWTWHEHEPTEQGPGQGYQSAGQKAFAGTTPVPTDINLTKQQRPEAAQGALL